MSGFGDLIGNFFEKITEYDNPDIKGWMLMDSPIPLFAIIAIYLVFVLKLGPYLMSDRKPFNLDAILIPYNAGLVLFNAYLFYFCIKNGILELVVTNCKRDFTEDQNHYLNVGTYWYFISKIIELLDTVFFVLRKKQNQVSFLHVYHHSSMAFWTWLFNKYVPKVHAVIPGFMNVFVHIVMYSYYLLAVFGPNVRKYLWWKRYLTTLQLVQFLLAGLCIMLEISNKCHMSKSALYIMIPNIVIYLGLFGNFYWKSYVTKEGKKSKIN